MLKKNMLDRLNEQITAEYYAAHLYLSMAAYCHTLNLNGFASWMKAQADEERVHATKLYDHVIERGGQVELGEIAKPPHNFKSIKDIMSKVLEHEKKVTGLIHKLYEAALSEGDHATKIMLEWFVTEQVEEEAQAEEMLKKLELANDDGSALLFLDDEVGKQRSSK